MVGDWKQLVEEWFYSQHMNKCFVEFIKEVLAATLIIREADESESMEKMKFLNFMVKVLSGLLDFGKRMDSDVNAVVEDICAKPGKYYGI